MGITREELVMVERHGGDDSSGRVGDCPFDHECFEAIIEFEGVRTGGGVLW